MQLSIQWVHGVVSPARYRGQTLLSISGVKNAWSCNSAPPYAVLSYTETISFAFIGPIWITMNTVFWDDTVKSGTYVPWSWRERRVSSQTALAKSQQPFYISLISQRKQDLIKSLVSHLKGEGREHAMTQFVEALRYKPEGRVFDSRWGHWHNPSGRTMALRMTQPLTEMSNRNISWGKWRTEGGVRGVQNPPRPPKFRRYRWSPRTHEQEEPASRFPFAVHCVLIRL